MKAADIMTTPVAMVQADASIGQAIRIMLQKRISGLPVVDAVGNLVGIVTEGDLLRRAEIGTAPRARWLDMLLSPGHLAETYSHSHARKIADVMTPEVVAVEEATPLAEIVRLMEQHGIKRVPVSRDGKVVGIVSRANLLHVLAGAMADIKPIAAGDKAIRDHVLAELKAESWAPVGSIDVTVRDGIVRLHGTIFDERSRRALRVMAENAPGAKGVEDHLIWIEPISGSYLSPASHGKIG